MKVLVGILAALCVAQVQFLLFFSSVFFFYIDLLQINLVNQKKKNGAEKKMWKMKNNQVFLFL